MVTVTRANALIAAGIVFVNSLIPFLQLVGVFHLSSDALAALYLVVSNFGTLLGLIFASTPVTNTP